MFKGTKGYIVCDFGSRILLPFGNDADLTYYKGRDKKDVVPPLGHFQLSKEYKPGWTLHG
ncbi:MAG: hypothetical protein ACYS67_07800 [Planctomycetota bacterium]|jgi:hypothetical protein